MIFENDKILAEAEANSVSKLVTYISICENLHLQSFWKFQNSVHDFSKNSEKYPEYVCINKQIWGKNDTYVLGQEVTDLNKDSVSF